LELALEKYLPTKRMPNDAVETCIAVLPAVIAAGFGYEYMTDDEICMPNTTPATE
jgi:hypothetical protein